MNVIICDDETIYINSIHGKIEDWAKLHNRSKAILIHHYSSSEDLLIDIEQGFHIDAIFLDIQIRGEISGMQLAKELHRYNEYLPVIFVTNYPEYAIEGYKVNALRFLHKPIVKDDIFDCMDIIWNRWQVFKTDMIVIDTPKQMLQFPINEILYIEVFGHSCKLHTLNSSQIFEFRLTLKQVRELLPHKIFAQCHRCYLINLMYVRHIKGNIVTLSNDLQITIGRIYRENFVQSFRDFYLRG